MMKSSNIKTFFTSNSILSELNAYNTGYTVFTMDCKHDESKHQSIIKFTEYQRKLWTLYALDTKEAVINHVALVNMAREHSLLNWNEKILQQCKPQHQVETLYQQKIIAKNNSFISSYSKNLFETTGLNANHSEIENDSKIIMVCIAAFALAILNFWIVYYG